MVNQSTPYGTLTYSQTGTNPDGTPKYTATQQLSSAQQGLLNQQQATQATLGSDANQLAGNMASSLTNGPDLSNDALVKKMMGWQTDYMQPTFNNQNSNLDSQLAAQGITQGSAAYDNAKRQLQQSQSGTVENAMANTENQAYNQSLSTYQNQLSTLGSLLGSSAPANLSSSFTQTPQEQVQPANYTGVAQQNYQNQNQQYANTMSGLFSIPSAVLGGWAQGGGVANAAKGLAGLFSDRRMKRHIEPVGTLFDGQPIYRFRYRDDPTMHIGLMAQDVAEIHPEAVGVADNGFMMVDYGRATDNAARRAND
ncbi:tail fiber domain-containing protein [Methylocapsa palsarum]|nr:tail fiber domain-containing protein [Methylocapsa palsarum]